MSPPPPPRASESSNTLTSKLPVLADTTAFPQRGEPERRWGQLLREGGAIGAELDRLRNVGALVPLRTVVTKLYGGVVTRANNYFLVTEIPFGEIPPRMRLTRNDHKRVAAVRDGLDFQCRIERRFLRPVLKGPESLKSATTVERSALRLFDVGRMSIDQLRSEDCNDALKYLHRGTTQPYDSQHDRLKGGIPARRSNIRNRKPYWYSLGVPEPEPWRVVFPEHIDRRYPATLLGEQDVDLVVIDKLYTATATSYEHALAITVSLNSILTWYQLELRGRTQLGQGVLEAKKPDWGGVLVMNTHMYADAVLDAFAPVSTSEGAQTLGSLDSDERVNFDTAILAALGVEKPDDFRLMLSREVAAAVEERRTRRQSVETERISRTHQRRLSAGDDARAARVAARIEPHPDPRSFVADGAEVERIEIVGHVRGELRTGDDLFTTGKVLADDEPVAITGGAMQAEFVLGVLHQDPGVVVVDVPTRSLGEVMTAWSEESRSWSLRFEQVLADSLTDVLDPRVRASVRSRALDLLHGSL